MSRIPARLDVVGVALLLLALTGSPVAAADPAPAPVSPFTVEEQRLDKAVPQEILRRSGFDTVAPRFAQALEGTRSLRQAERAVVQQGAQLWDRAVDRAQGRGPARGDLSRDDDRPLYWARLGMTRELRQWQPEFGLTDTERARLLDRLERSSRGQDSMNLPAGEASSGS